MTKAELKAIQSLLTKIAMNKRTQKTLQKQINELIKAMVNSERMKEVNQ